MTWRVTGIAAMGVIAEVEMAVATPLWSKSTTASHDAVALPTRATEPGLGDYVQRRFEVQMADGRKRLGGGARRGRSRRGAR